MAKRLKTKPPEGESQPKRTREMGRPRTGRGRDYKVYLKSDWEEYLHAMINQGIYPNIMSVLREGFKLVVERDLGVDLETEDHWKD